MNLEIQIENLNDGVATIKLVGEIDVYTATKLKTDIDAELAKGLSRLIVHLDQVEYMDSSGLGVFINTMKLLQEKNGTLVLIGPTPRLTRLFELTGLAKIFTIYDTVEQAYAHETVAVQ